MYVVIAVSAFHQVIMIPMAFRFKASIESGLPPLSSLLKKREPIIIPGRTVVLEVVRLHDTQSTMYCHTHSKSMDQAGKVVNPARGQLDRKNEYLPVRVRA